MGRRAIGATLVSVVLFTTLLIANASLYSAESSYLSATNLSVAQQREAQYASLLVGLSAYSSLEGVQRLLQSTPIACSSAPAFLSSMSGEEHNNGSYQGIAFEIQTSWGHATAGATGNNPADLQPYQGYSAGALNIEVTTSVAESFLGGLPSYHTEELDVVHLPVFLEQQASFCLSVLSTVGQSLSSLPACNSTSIQDALGVIESSYVYPGSVYIGGSATPSGGQCYVEYWVTIAQSYEGVSGTFEVSVDGSGSLSI